MARRAEGRVVLNDDPLWYKDAIIYELHVRAFLDSDGDGIGDFPGLTSKLDYLRDLGVTAIWLLPFYPSPLKDDGYDIADYTNVHPAYGTLHDFNVFLKEAHRRGLRVVTELVLNHTSDQHPWFQRARREPPGSRFRDFYVWSETPDRYADARIIFKDFEPSNWTWDALAKAYYWHRFYAHQPDLNFDNPQVRKAVLQVLDFWFELGVDGMRLDAVPYLYEREGTNCENLKETHAFLKDLRRHVEHGYRSRMFLAEANQWPEDACAYFGNGDECHMAFHFPLMPRLFMATRMESRFPILEILEQTPQIPEGSQWAIFLRNHDELTLEMVTDEERDYMYRVYAHDPNMRINVGIRRRLAPLVDSNRRKIELLNGLLLSLPGTPVIYYGDEIGMGDNVYLGDRDGVRTPMQWSADSNAGFSRANPQQLYLPIIIDPAYQYEALNVESQQKNPSSLLWWMKRLIAIRARFKSFGRGTIEFLHPENHKVLAFIRRAAEGVDARRAGEERVLVVANLSRFVQCVELGLSAYEGMVPVELFGRTPFPPIGTLPYFITLGPHGFYWFLLEPSRAPGAAPAGGEGAPPVLEVAGDWTGVFEGDARQLLERLLPAYLSRCRWFGGKAKHLRAATLLDVCPVTPASCAAFIRAVYGDGEPETYFLPLAFAPGARAEAFAQAGSRTAVLAGLRTRAGDGVLIDAVHDPGFCAALLDAIARRKQFRGQAGVLQVSTTKVFRRLHPPGVPAPAPALLGAEQSNTSVVFGDRSILKLLRRVADGITPDLELGLFLTERTTFAHIAPVAGALEYRTGKRGQAATVGVLQAFVPNEGDAWRHALEAMSHFYERAMVERAAEPAEAPGGSLAARLSAPLPRPAVELIGTYLDSARMLGTRTAQLHLALAGERSNPEFAPEPLTTHYQRSIYQSMRSQALSVLERLRKRLGTLPAASRPLAERVAGSERALIARFQRILERRLAVSRIRCHGDYHLGQVLFTGKDFIIIDFEGEPARSLSERRLKRSPLRDVAGMVRSFHYAAWAAALKQTVDASAAGALAGWSEFWSWWVAQVFLRAYLETARDAPFVPKTQLELEVLLDAFLLEKAVYEIGYELNNRPDWIGIPLRGIARLLELPA